MRLLRYIYHHLIGKRRQELPFLILFSFLLTFGGARLIVYLTLEGFLPEMLFLNVGGVRVHHLSYGIFILAIFGYLFLIYPRFAERHVRFLSLVYGFGLGLTFDEFGMWMHLKDDYWIRHSFDAVVVLTALLLNIVYFTAFWRAMGRALMQPVIAWQRRSQERIAARIKSHLPHKS